MFQIVLSILLAGSGQYSITIAKPLTLIVRDRTQLFDACRTRKVVYGCTLFAAERLFCVCERRGAAWHLHADASFIPVIYLAAKRPDVRPHEELHIADVQTRLVAYLQAMTTRSYGTEQQCARDAASASDALNFTRRMNEFRQQSNDALD